MDTRGQRQIAAGMELGMHLPVTSGLWLIVATMTARLPLACSLQDSDRGMAQAGNRAGKTQPCKQMGERAWT